MGGDSNVVGQINEVVQNTATPDNLAFATNTLSNLVSLLIKLTQDAYALIQQNIYWAVVIVILIALENFLINYTGFPFPRGKLRYLILFFITMFFSWVFVPFFGAWVG